MLELRPTCEHCNKPLPPDSTEAMICTFECTFCRDCVDEILENVCPNCGGGFSPRPNRPQHNLKNNNDTEHYPPTTQITHKPVDMAGHQEFARKIKIIPPHKR